MKINFNNRDIVVALVAVVVGAGIGSTLLPQETVGSVSPRRMEYGSYRRDSHTELLTQQRRNERLQEMQEDAYMHGSADVDPVDVFTYYQAYLECRRAGYTPGRVRFNECLEAVLLTGDYNALN